MILITPYWHLSIMVSFEWNHSHIFAFENYFKIDTSLANPNNFAMCLQCPYWRGPTVIFIQKFLRTFLVNLVSWYPLDIIFAPPFPRSNENKSCWELTGCYYAQSENSRQFSSKFEPAQSWWESIRVGSQSWESCNSHPRLTEQGWELSLFAF